MKYFDRKVARNTIISYVDAFIEDDCLLEEELELRKLLLDKKFPRNINEYEKKCLEILGHIPDYSNYPDYQD